MKKFTEGFRNGNAIFWVTAAAILWIGISIGIYFLRDMM